MAAAAAQWHPEWDARRDPAGPHLARRPWRDVGEGRPMGSGTSFKLGFRSSRAFIERVGIEAVDRYPDSPLRRPRSSSVLRRAVWCDGAIAEPPRFRTP